MKWLGLIPVEKVKANPWNAVELPEEDYKTLKAQMRISGPERTEAITVRRVDEFYEIVNGEKRWRIAKELGWKQIPAQELENASTYDAKKYCISYNLLRGTLNYVKLAKLMLNDEELYKAYAELAGGDKAKELRESAAKLKPEAEKVLDEGVKKGVEVKPEEIRIVVEAPPENQPEVAVAATSADKTTFLKAYVQQIPQPAITEEERRALKSGDEEAKRKVKAKVKAMLERTVRAEVIESHVDVEQPGRYIVYYDPEKKSVGLKLVKTVKFTEEGEEHEFEATERISLLPKTLTFSFKCDCGRVWTGVVNADEGKVTAKSEG